MSPSVKVPFLQYGGSSCVELECSQAGGVLWSMKIAIYIQQAEANPVRDRRGHLSQAGGIERRSPQARLHVLSMRPAGVPMPRVIGGRQGLGHNRADAEKEGRESKSN
jgi:hypothetical protein